MKKPKKLLKWTSDHDFAATCIICALLCMSFSAYYFFTMYFNINISNVSRNNGEIAIFQDAVFEQEYREAINRPSGVIYLKELQEVTNLTITDNRQLRSIDDLLLFPNLTQLTIKDCSIENISAISKLENLEYLDLSGNKIEDISSLCKLKELEELNISSNSIEIVPLDFWRLESLSILYFNNNMINDIKNILRVRTLQELYVKNNQISEINVYWEIPNLTILDIGGNPITHIETLKRLSGIEELNIAHTGVEDIRFLYNTTLIELDISYTGICDLSPLVKCSEFQTLKLYGIEDIDLSPLKNIPSFNSIYLDSGFDYAAIDFMIGNYKTGDLHTRIYLCGEKNGIL